MVHDTGGGGKDDVTKLTSWEKLDNPLLEIGETDVVSWGDDTGLVETTVELDNDLAGTVVIDLLELSDVAWEKLVCCDNINSKHHDTRFRGCVRSSAGHSIGIL